jgi:hypothetical protein
VLCPRQLTQGRLGDGQLAQSGVSTRCRTSNGLPNTLVRVGLIRSAAYSVVKAVPTGLSCHHSLVSLRTVGSTDFRWHVLNVRWRTGFDKTRTGSLNRVCYQ